MVAQAVPKDEGPRLSWLGLPVWAGLILVCCLLCATGVRAAEPSKLKVVVRPPIKKTLPQRPHAARPDAPSAQPADPLPAVGPDGVARLAERYAGQHGVEPRLVMAIIKVESGFDAKAVSSAGASGLMQLMPGTQRHLGVRDAFNPDENVEGGVRYFRSMLDRYGGNVSLALAAYNAGPANVDKYGGIPPFEETRNYVRKVLALYATP
mgnify:CR=1 FL=1